MGFAPHGLRSGYNLEIPTHTILFSICTEPAGKNKSNISCLSGLTTGKEEYIVITGKINTNTDYSGSTRG